MIEETEIANFFAAGLPKGQPRPRAFARGGKAAVYDPGTAEGWKSSVAMAAKDKLDGLLLEGPLLVELVFRMPRPKMHFGKKGLKERFACSLFTKKPDADNLAKAVLDAMTVIGVWKDDDQVTDLIIRKRYADPCGITGCQIRICELNDRSDS